MTVVTLAPRTAEHARALFPLVFRTAVCDTLVWDGPASEEEFLRTYGKPGEARHRDLTILSDGLPVGALSVRPGFQAPRGDLGYWVGVPHQGKGIGTAAVAAALEVAFGPMGMEKVEACAFVGNLPSRRILEKNGFREEGLVRKAILKRGRWVPEWLLGITREEWEARRAL